MKIDGGNRETGLEPLLGGGALGPQRSGFKLDSISGPRKIDPCIWGSSKGSYPLLEYRKCLPLFIKYTQ